ncbi:enoyl-CoA hydratase [Endozoicomonas sp. OPT23]|uniref:enoyl-CoA hydratase n=1 Tax=Endozoicomonas sp. OPT23 TaxID=2072845 RepID=UPI00129A460A|nr:enoyl-CoA hydratase [Endozoicomonas sp. OPT23]MRI34984.1 enoyl-CoA hydratase [Endozoicomonas sp. OPT23]
MNAPLLLTTDGHIATITLNNPPANTWTLESLNLLRDTVRELNSHSAITGLIIRSDSEKFFSAGADLKLFQGVTPEQARPMTEAFGEAFEALTDFRGVSVAAVNGFSLGGGFEVALACDFRVVEKTALLGLPEAAVGLLPCAGGTQNLMWLAGESWAKRMILCGEKVSGEKAFEIGLADELVEQGEASEAAVRLLKATDAQSPDAILACKELIQMNRVGARNSNIVERELFLELFKGTNQNEGVSAFLEKRKPEWDYS